MLLIFKVPIADIRSFFKDSKETKISSTPNDFIRGFGKRVIGGHSFNTYKVKLRKLWCNNNKYVYYTAKRGLRFVYKDGQEKTREIHNNLFCAEGIYDFRVAFRHFCFVKNNSKKENKKDTEITNSSTVYDDIGHFEVGFFLRFPANEIDIHKIRKACTAIARLRTQQYRIEQSIDSPAARKVVSNALIHSSKTIANYFCASTTRMRENTAVPVKDRKKLDSHPYNNYIETGTPVFMAALEEDEHFQLPDGGWRLGYPSKSTWHYSEVSVHKKGDGTVKLFVLEKGRKTSPDLHRELLSSLSIIHDEYQGMILITDLIEKNNALSKPYCTELERFQTLSPSIKETIEHGLKKIDKNCKSFNVIDTIGSGEKYNYNSLLMKMKKIDGNINKIKKKYELQKKLEELSTLMKTFTYPDGFPEEDKKHIDAILIRFLEDAGSDKPDTNEVKSIGQKIIDIVNTTAVFLKPIAAIVEGVCKIIIAVTP